MWPKTSRITEENYNEEIALLLDGIHRCRDGWNQSKAFLAEGIGNLLQEFDAPKAREWFQEALAWYRTDSFEPAVKIALLLLKLGDSDAAPAECERVLKFQHNRRQRIEQGAPSLPPNQVWRAHQESTCAHFLLGQFQEAIDSAEEGLRAGCEDGAPYVQTAISSMAKGILQNDAQHYREGVEILRQHIREWPTASSSLHEDLYRHAQLAGRKYFAETN
jgi:tetratricopeptide (TPR) repeat protein